MDVLALIGTIITILFGTYTLIEKSDIARNIAIIAIIISIISWLSLIPKEIIQEKIVTDSFYPYNNNSLLVKFDKPVEIVKTIIKSRYGFELFKQEKFSIKTGVCK